VFSIPEPWRGDRKHTTSWIKQTMGDSFYHILHTNYSLDYIYSRVTLLPDIL
jgi:hypothetical protein